MTNPTSKIVESTATHAGSRVVLPEGKGLKGEIRLMGWEPGADFVEGSSGAYPVPAIVRDFPEAFPKGTRVRANHDGFCEAGGDIRRVIAKTTGAPKEREDGMYAPVVFDEQWSPWLKQFADVVGMSISAGAEPEMVALTDESGEPILDDQDEPVLVTKKNENGLTVIKRFLTAQESPYNSVDVVEAPGADGRIVALALEAAQTRLGSLDVREAAHFTAGTRKPVEETSEAVPPRNQREDHEVDKKELEESFAAQEARLRSIISEALAPSVPSRETSSKDVAEAIVQAGLSKEAREAVYERLDRGEELTEAIAREKAREDAVEARVKAALTKEHEVNLDSFTTGFDEQRSVDPTPSGLVDIDDGNWSAFTEAVR